MTKKTKEPALKEPQKKLFDFAFGRTNYIIMIAGLAVLLIGFLLLAGGGSSDPETFSYNLFNTRRLVVAPIVITLGFVVEIVAIMYRPKK